MNRHPAQATVEAPAGPLTEAVARLVAALQPERIYLFGSQARGDATEDSDYDLLIVIPDVDDQRFMQTRREANRALDGLRIPAEIHLWTHERFERQAPVVASLPATVLREGKLLYAAPNFASTSHRVAEPSDGPDYSASARDEKLWLVREWLVKSARDLQTGERAIVSPPLAEIAVSHCQQATEKALKAHLAWRDVPGRKVHNLVEILTDCTKLDADFASLAAAARVLTQYAVDPRYPGMKPDPSVADAVDVLALAREVVEFVIRRLPPGASP